MDETGILGFVFVLLNLYFCFLLGLDFSRAANSSKKVRPLQAAEKPGPEGGGGFNPRIKPAESIGPSGPEVRFSDFSFGIRPFFRSLFSPYVNQAESASADRLLLGASRGG
jgi:hypothetical protein